MRALSYLLIFVLLSSCSINDQKLCCALPDDLGIAFAIDDQDGLDLLDPDHPHAFTKQNIDIYYLIGEEKIRVFEGHLNDPKKFSIHYYDPPMDRYIMNLWGPNKPANKNESSAITIIEFPNSKTDTLNIEAEFLGSTNRWMATKAWYNGELKWDANVQHHHESGRLIAVTKKIDE